MSDTLIKKITQRALESINEIESRTTDFLGQSLSIDDYKKLHYFENRDLESYFALLPGLENLIDRESRILDIGCGTGLALKELRDTFGCEVIGTTINKKAQDLDTVQCKADKLPFSNDSFDIVLSVHGISWEPNQRKAFNEIVRILKPGGTAFVYLLPFSYSIDLFVGNIFWNELNREKYVKEYEFSPNSIIPGATCFYQKHDYPENKVNDYCSEWFVKIKKRL